LGEFAWAFEDMLNRVIDRTLLPGSNVFAVLRQAPEALKQLIGQLRDGLAPTMDIAGLTDQAHALHRAPIAEPVAGKELGSAPVLDEAPAVAVLPVEESDGRIPKV
jgi:chemosensory pili system protein ChpA (sensor histidine kinase/response regulator)